MGIQRYGSWDWVGGRNRVFAGHAAMVMSESQGSTGIACLVWRVCTEGNVMIAWSVGCDGEAHGVLCLVFARRGEENVGG